jgi:hypothetical protein
MESKVPPPPPSQIADIPQAGNPVIYKADKPVGNHLSLPQPNLKLTLASVVMLFLVGGVGVGVYLVGQQQQIQSRASNEIPNNLSAVVPKNVVNSATPSATPATASSAGSLTNITIPELDSSDSADLSSSESALMSDIYDFNGDQAINSLDLSIMYAGWGTPKNDPQKNSDLNGDGIINGIDYSIFLPQFSKPI